MFSFQYASAELVDVSSRSFPNSRFPGKENFVLKMPR